jgi:hypothetical protein
MVWTSLDSIAHGIYRYVCPLYWVDSRERVFIVGSAVPFEHDGFRWLLTAAHVCFDDARNPQPLFALGNNRPWALTEIRSAWQLEAGRPDVDVGVIALSTDCGDDLAGFYRFSTIQDMSTLLPKSDSTYYMIAGYPYSRNRLRPGEPGAPSRAIFFVMRETLPISRLKSKVANSDDVHFAVAVPPEHHRVGDGRFHVPKLQGMSGGGIWRFEIDNRTRLVTTRSLVGIAIEHHRKERAIVGCRVELVMPLVTDLSVILKSTGAPR